MINKQWYAVLPANEVKKSKVVGVRRFGDDIARQHNTHHVTQSLTG